MNSSTSSSKKVALYTILLATVILGSASWLVNAFTDSTEKNAGDVFGIQRIRSVVDSLDYIANTKEPSVIVFGSSLIKDGFSPRYYDETLKNQYDIDVKSFNLGLGNMKAVSSGPTTKMTSSPRTCASREPSARRFPNRIERVGID